MSNRATFTIEDFSQEKGRMSVNIGPVTALNYTAVHDAIDDLKNALPAITLGEIRQTMVSESFLESVTPVSDDGAHRENKWLVTLRDDTQFFDVANTISNVGYGRLFTVEVPTADGSLLEAGTEQLSLTAAGVPAFIAALEAVAQSPTGGNDVSVVSIRHVSRNS